MDSSFHRHIDLGLGYSKQKSNELKLMKSSGKSGSDNDLKKDRSTVQ